jgi:hypothetical protein
MLVDHAVPDSACRVVARVSGLLQFTAHPLCEHLNRLLGKRLSRLLVCDGCDCHDRGVVHVALYGD